jgi:hypothetical protein
LEEIELADRWDMEDYIKMVCDPLEIDSVIDIGTGDKGPVAQHYWENTRKIKRGYLCDIWVIKECPSLWKPLKMNALDLLDVLEPKSVDVVQACGFLEHLTLKEAIKFIFDVAEVIAKKVVYFSAAITCHAVGKVGYDPDYKVKIDANPYHEYKSLWNDTQFRHWGYETNIEDIRSGKFLFTSEIEAWKVL